MSISFLHIPFNLVIALLPKPPSSQRDHSHYPNAMHLQQKQSSQYIIVDGERHAISYVNEILQKIDGTIPYLTLQFSRLHNKMMISDTPNEEADSVRLRHFAMNAYVNGLVVQRETNEEFLTLIIGLIARVQLEILMYRYKYSHDSEFLHEIRIILACIVYFKELNRSKLAPIDQCDGLWPNNENDCYEFACKMAAAKYPDMRDRRASALFFSQLLHQRPISTNPFETGNVDMYAYVTTGNTIQMIWDGISCITVEEMKTKQGESYILSQGDLSDLEALDLLSHKGAKALRARSNKTYCSVKFNKVSKWNLSDPVSEYIQVRTKTRYVILAYIYIVASFCLSGVVAFLNLARRDTILDRFFDAVRVFFITTFFGFATTKLFSRNPDTLSSLLTGSRRLDGLERLGQYHGRSIKSLLLLMADAEMVSFPGDLNACYVTGPKNGTVDLPLMVTERDLYGSIIVGDQYAFDNKGAWRFIETKQGVLHIGADVPEGKPLLAIRRQQNRYVGGSNH